MLGIVYKNMPITTEALKLPRRTYEMLIDIQPALNRLLINMSRDLKFMEAVLKNCDAFTENLLNLHRALLCEEPYGIASKADLGVFRMDYIVIDDGRRPKQVEMNTIAAGLAGIMPRVVNFHKYTFEKYRKTVKSKPIQEHKPPEMDKHLGMPEALARAHHFYNKTQPKSNGSSNGGVETVQTGILFVIENFVVNIFDHKTIEMHDSLANIPVYRAIFRTLDEKRLRLGPNRELLLRTGANTHVEISVVYFRTTYDPKDYDFEGSWKIRAQIERSRAIKCPSLALQLVGAKVFQTVLTKPEILERFLSPCDHHKKKQISETFVSFYPINNDVLKMVQKFGAENYVLKQNREGGGYNIFGREIIPKLGDILRTGKQEEYLLMDYINQTPEIGYVIGHKNRPLVTQNSKNGSNLLNTELGIFGSILVTPCGNEIFSAESSYLLRVKPVGCNELGIMSGQGAVSSLNLID